MPFSEKIQHLDEQIRAALETTVRDLRQEMLERLQAQHHQALEDLEGLSLDLPRAWLRPDDLEPLLKEAIAEAEVSAHGRGLAELKQALVEIDRARSQAQILGALLEQGTLIASRAALFLVRPGQVRGWGGSGFGEAEEALRAFRLDTEPGSAWERLLAGRSSVRLDSAERARLCSHLEIPVPQEAVLIPLVLRDRVAGALYADRISERPGTLAVDALQTLTYITALALETLPLRERDSTPTLRWEEEASEVEGLAVWEPGTEPPRAAVEAAERFTEEPAPAEGPSEAAPMAAEPELEAAVMEEVETAIAEEVETFEESVPDLGEIEISTEELGDLELEVEGEEAMAEGEVEPEDLPDLSVPAWSLEQEAEPEASAEPEPPPPLSVPEPPKPQAGPVLVPETRDETRPGVEIPSSPTPSSQLPGLYGTPGAGPQVAPPSDVQGPGWAFTAPQERDGDEEARHEEARRLARLLVSEIKLYNEDQVQEGRSNHDLWERLKDDIERSRQLYEARVDERVREKVDYFYQEVVRILGGGDPKTLGI